MIFDAVPAANHLEDFERLIVRTQGCQVEEMKWFIAMAEGFFPYLRDLCPARFIVVHIGPSQQAGKTSGAQRFTLLHGLGPVKGDYSVASLGNMSDIGLLVMDNKEQANFDRNLTDFCLFLATGAERARSSSEGKLRTSNRRPCGVITSIEGVSKAELQNRCVEVEYLITGEKLGRAVIEQEISEKRHHILSAMVSVFQRFFQIQAERRPTPNPLPEFEEHFTALCTLLRAYGDIAQKSQGWAEEIIGVWDSVLTSKEVEESELEQPVIRALEQNQVELDHQPYGYKGATGTLYITDATTLLSMLQKLNLRDRAIPKNAQGLSRRLRGDRFRFLVLIDGNSALEVVGLRRTQKRRPIGLFIPDDVVTELKSAA